MKTVRENIELFHLLFLEQLSHKLDKSLYAVKGGCNLRFFYNSIRYSEDIDFDIKKVAVKTLRNKIDRILDGQSFKQILAAQQISIENFSTPKQTDTTQRWKVLITTPNAALPIHTKIEFSRRQLDEEILFDTVDQSLISHYKLQTYFTSHYSKNLAFIQKVQALISRTQTQARDIFDLFLLMNQNAQPQLSDKLLSQIQIAQENTLSIGYDEYISQVVSYLTPDKQDNYTAREVWDKIQLAVYDKLSELSRVKR